VSVGGISWAKSQWIHDCKWTRTHGNNVAHNSTHARCSSLIRLDIRRVVVTFYFESNRPTLTNINYTGIFTNTHKKCVSLGGFLTELTQVDLARFIRTMLTPHDGVHGEFATRGSASKYFLNAFVFVRLEAQLRKWLLKIGLLRCMGHRVDHDAPTNARTALVKKGIPSRLGPVSASTACSGCGMRPTTLPRAFDIPAISR